MGSRAKLNTSSFLLVAPFSTDSIFITCDLNLDMRFVLILNYKHVRTAGLTVYWSNTVLVGAEWPGRCNLYCDGRFVPPALTNRTAPVPTGSAQLRASVNSLKLHILWTCPP